MKEKTHSDTNLKNDEHYTITLIIILISWYTIDKDFFLITAYDFPYKQAMKKNAYEINFK